jgi:hypothetical protein
LITTFSASVLLFGVAQRQVVGIDYRVEQPVGVEEVLGLVWGGSRFFPLRLKKTA